MLVRVGSKGKNHLSLRITGFAHPKHYTACGINLVGFRLDLVEPKEKLECKNCISKLKQWLECLPEEKSEHTLREERKTLREIFDNELVEAAQAIRKQEMI